MPSRGVETRSLSRTNSVLVVWVLFSVCGCSTRLRVPSEDDYLSLGLDAMATKAAEYRKGSLSGKEVQRIATVLAGDATNPIYRGFLWEVILQHTDAAFRREHPVLWFARRREIDSAITKAHGFDGELRNDLEFWAGVERETGIRLAI